MNVRFHQLMALVATLTLVASVGRAQASDEIQKSDKRYAEIYAMRIELQGDLRTRLEEALDRIARPFDFFVMVQIQVSGELHKIIDRETKAGMDIKVGAAEQVKLPGLPSIKGPKGGGRNPNVLLKLPGESRETIRNELQAVIEKLKIKIYIEDGASEEQIGHMRQTALEVADLDIQRGDTLVVETMASRQVAGRALSGALVARQSVWIFCITLFICALVIAIGLRRRQKAGENAMHMSGSLTGGGVGADGHMAGGPAGLLVEQALGAVAEDEDVAAEGRFVAVRGLGADDLLDVLLDVPVRTAAAMVDCGVIPGDLAAVFFDKQKPEARLKWVEHLARAAVVPVTEIEVMEQQAQEAVDKVNSRVKLGNALRVADILSDAGHEETRQVLDALAQRDPGLVDTIRKGMMLFEDLPSMGEDEIREVVSVLDPGVVVVSLQGVKPALRDAVLKTLSRRLRSILASEEEVTKPQEGEIVEAARKQVEAMMRRVRKSRAKRRQRVGA